MQLKLDWILAVSLLESMKRGKHGLLQDIQHVLKKGHIGEPLLEY